MLYVLFCCFYAIESIESTYALTSLLAAAVNKLFSSSHLVLFLFALKLSAEAICFGPNLSFHLSFDSIQSPKQFLSKSFHWKTRKCPANQCCPSQSKPTEWEFCFRSRVQVQSNPTFPPSHHRSSAMFFVCLPKVFVKAFDRPIDFPNININRGDRADRFILIRLFRISIQFRAAKTSHD